MPRAILLCSMEFHNHARFSKAREKQEERDIFREIPLRYLGYANEVGEAFRHLVPVRVVYLSYALSSGYVVSHAASQGYKAHNNGRVVHPHHRTQSKRFAVLDTLIWQGFASVIIPGLTINRLCALSRFLLNRHARNLLTHQVRKWAVTGIGLGSIPFIIHPIDSAVDKCMDWKIRPLLEHYFR